MSEGEEQRRRVGGTEIGGKGNFEGCILMRTLANIQYTLH